MNSREKGKRIERLLASMFTRAGWPARRGQQFKGTPDSPDVIVEDLPLTVECKGREVWSIYNWIVKVRHEAKPGTLPLLCCKKNHSEFLAIMTLDDFLDLTPFVDWEKYEEYKRLHDVRGSL